MCTCKCCNSVLASLWYHLTLSSVDDNTASLFYILFFFIGVFHPIQEHSIEVFTYILNVSNGLIYIPFKNLMNSLIIRQEIINKIV